MKCLKCGKKVPIHSEFCNKCGYHFTEEEIKAANDAHFIKDSAKSALDSINASEVKAIILSSMIFVITATGLGMLFSLIIANTITDIAGTETFKLGAVSVWLMTCLSGTDLLFAVTLPVMGTFSIDIRLYMGFMLLLIIPALSLLVARVVRHFIMKRCFPDRETGIKDAVLGALIFALFNLALSFIPSSMEAGIRDTTIAAIGEYLQSIAKTVHNAGFTGLGGWLASAERMDKLAGALTFNMNPLSHITFLTSFALAFLFAMPGLRVLRTRTDLTGSTLSIAWVFVTRMLFAGFCVSVSLLIYLAIRAEESAEVMPALLLLPNFVVWTLSMLSGGTFEFLVRGIEHSSAPGAGMESITFTDMYSGLSSNWGLAVMLIGVLVAFVALYPIFRDKADTRRIRSTSAVVSGVLICVISALTTFFIDITLESTAMGFVEGTLLISAGTLRTFITTIIVFAAALWLIYTTQTTKWLDDIMLKITARHSASLGVTALLSILAAIAIINMFNNSNLANLLILLGA